MEKRILNKIAKDWAKGILFATGTDSFDEELDYILTIEEQSYIVEKVQEIGDRLTKDKRESNLSTIIKKYYDFK